MNNSLVDGNLLMVEISIGSAGGKQKNYEICEHLSSVTTCIFTYDRGDDNEKHRRPVCQIAHEASAQGEHGRIIRDEFPAPD